MNGLVLDGYVERLRDLFITLVAFDNAFLTEYYDGLLFHGLNTRDCPQLVAHLNSVRQNGGDEGKEAEHLIVAHGFARISGTVH